MVVLRRWILFSFFAVLVAGCVAPAEPTVSEGDVATAISEMAMTETPLPPTEVPTETAIPATPTATLFPTHFCQPEVLITPGHFLLARPIGPEGNQQIDLLYCYGHTVNGAFKPHRGVEFLNPTGMAVRAAADGVVVFAGWDSAEAIANDKDFYGQVVVIRHDFAEMSMPVFTLYGHLSEILVSAGETVFVGQEISRVGMTGIATGEHLHFEVRVGENSYAATRNPELWLAPLMDEEGIEKGAVAGYLIDEDGKDWAVVSFVIESTDDAGRIYYPEGYQGNDVNADDPWGEAFAIGELPVGAYQISLVHGGVQERAFTIEAGKLTIVPVCLEK